MRHVSRWRYRADEAGNVLRGGYARDRVIPSVCVCVRALRVVYVCARGDGRELDG